MKLVFHSSTIPRVYFEVVVVVMVLMGVTSSKCTDVCHSAAVKRGVIVTSTLKH